MPADGGPSRFVFGDNWEPNPNGWGDRESMGPEHYAWLVAVDPRGALLVAGMGEHGISRLRAKRTDRSRPGRALSAPTTKARSSGGADRRTAARRRSR